MGVLDKQAYEGKREWAARRAAGNRENCSTLTEEQHDVLEWICTIRHDMHTSKESIWDGNLEALRPFDNSCGIPEIESRIKEAGLPEFCMGFDYVELVTADDYHNVISDSERDKWEEKAEEYNSSHPDGMWHCGASMWKEESGEYEKFLNDLEFLNESIEKYLKTIDEKHGTNYAPTGYTRIY